MAARKHLWGESAHIPLTKQRYGFGIEWDTVGHKNQDLDLQAVIVDNHGMVVDAVYYNNLNAIDGAVGCSGETRTSADEKSETIWVALSDLPEHIQLIFLVICAHKHHALCDSDSGSVVLRESWGEKPEVARFKIAGPGSGVDADIVGMMKRDGDKAWQFKEIDNPAMHGSHFLDILEPNIGGLIRNEIPNAPKCQKVSFNMKKGGVVNLPGTQTLKRLSISLDADVAQNVHEPVDIDIAAVFYGEEGNLLGAADSINDQMFGVAHGGETHFRVHDQIDESLSVDLMQVPESVAHIFLVLTISHGTFKNVERLQTRILDQAAHDLVSFEVPAGHSEAGLIVARLFFVHTRLSKRWSLEAVGSFFSEPTANWSGHVAQKEMLKILHQANPDKVSLKHSHTSHSEHHHEHHGADHAAGHKRDQADQVAKAKAKADAKSASRTGQGAQNAPSHRRSSGPPAAPANARAEQGRNKKPSEAPAQAEPDSAKVSSDVAKSKEDEAKVASSSPESASPAVEKVQVQPESSVPEASEQVAPPNAAKESSSWSCTTADHLREAPQATPVVSSTLTERKPGSMRLRVNADAKVNPNTSTAEPVKDSTLATEEEVPAANYDEAEEPRSWKKCGDSHFFSFFGSCGAKS